MSKRKLKKYQLIKEMEEKKLNGWGKYYETT